MLELFEIDVADVATEIATEDCEHVLDGQRQWQLLLDRAPRLARDRREELGKRRGIIVRRLFEIRESADLPATDGPGDIAAPAPHRHAGGHRHELLLVERRAQLDVHVRVGNAEPPRDAEIVKRVVAGPGGQRCERGVVLYTVDDRPRERTVAPDVEVGGIVEVDDRALVDRSRCLKPSAGAARRVGNAVDHDRALDITARDPCPEPWSS